jgi:hypothetical protein
MEESVNGIRIGRVIAGGLVAGLIVNIGETILNVPLAGEEMAQALQARNLPPVGGGAIGYFVIMCFLLGVLMVWTYAAVRPRLGPGPKTAVIVAVLVWFLTLVWSGGTQVAMGIMPLSLTLFGLVWGLGELVIASLVGAKLYQE